MDCHLPRLLSTSASHQNQDIKEMTLVRMSVRLLVDARLHVSFSFPFLFSFPFILYRKLKKYTHSFNRNFLRRDRCGLK